MTFGKAMLAAVVGAADAAVVNAAIFLLSDIPQDVLTPMDQPITLGAVVAVSAVPLILAGAVMYGLRSRIGTYRLIAVIVTLASLASPFGLEGAPTGMLVALSVMHLVAGGVAVWFLPWFATRGVTG